ncbi:MAG: DUF11 domain-containing protein [Acidobacteria bacterium]|nr:DUF11 domain-containing protein [Acidobacteriota bacterium]
MPIYDPGQENVPPQNNPKLSDGRAAKLAYGPGFGGANNGIVMYQGSHDIGGTDPQNVEAERAFFNFVLLSGINQRPSITLGGIPPVFIPGQSYAFTTTVTGGNPAFAYAWTSSCGGSFSPSASNPNPTFTAPNMGTGCNILVTVTDACLRANFAFTYPEIPLQATADLAITKTNGVTTVNAGSTTNFYTVVVTNNGPSAAGGATISDPAVAGLTKTGIGACTALGGAVCPAAGNGAGQLGITNLEAGTVAIPTLPSGGSVTFSITTTVTATIGSVTNTATVTEPAGVTDTNTANNTASDTDPVTPVSNLVIVKTDGVLQSMPGAALPTQSR